MPRGGARLGAGRKPDPTSKRQQGLAAKAVTTVFQSAPVPKAFAPTGKKVEDAPKDWPFGTVQAAEEVEVLPPSEPKEPLTALAFFQKIYRDESEDMRTRLGAAAQALPYENAKPAPVGKKEARNEAAKKTAGRFSPSAPPRLAATGGKAV